MLLCCDFLFSKNKKPYNNNNNNNNKNSIFQKQKHQKKTLKTLKKHTQTRTWHMGQSQALQEEEEPLVVVPFAMNEVPS